MGKTPDQIRTALAGFQMDEDGKGDNLAIAICTYFDSHPDRPGDDKDDDDGWSPWVRENYRRVMRGLVTTITT